jgi:hypothetical protein
LSPKKLVEIHFFLFWIQTKQQKGAIVTEKTLKRERQSVMSNNPDDVVPDRVPVPVPQDEDDDDPPGGGGGSVIVDPPRHRRSDTDSSGSAAAGILAGDEMNHQQNRIEADNEPAPTVVPPDVLKLWADVGKGLEYNQTGTFTK